MISEVSSTVGILFMLARSPTTALISAQFFFFFFYGSQLHRPTAAPDPAACLDCWRHRDGRSHWAACTPKPLLAAPRREDGPGCASAGSLPLPNSLRTFKYTKGKPSTFFPSFHKETFVCQALFSPQEKVKSAWWM